MAIPTGATCMEAATIAAETFATDEIERHAQMIAEAWKVRLQEQSKIYTKRLLALTRNQHNGEVTESAEPITMLGAIPYQWWNLLLAGPFQPGVPFGPFLPNKVIRQFDPAFMLVALWRNPAPLGGGPSAAAIMSPFTCQVRLETVDLTGVLNGPDFVPPAFVLGGGNINIVPVILPPAAFVPAPVQGTPRLYEMHATVDIIGPGPGLPPFAGFATWMLDPDAEPPFLFGLIPGTAPQFQHDIPVRFVRYV
jgi:hypothetical protein